MHLLGAFLCSGIKHSVHSGFSELEGPSIGHTWAWAFKLGLDGA